jgi:hypothetical protein
VTVKRFTNDDDNNGLTEVAVLRGPARGLAPKARVARIVVRGVTATVAYRLDFSEHARRRAVGLLAVTDLEVLDALLGLPTDLPIQMEALGSHVRPIIRDLPAGCVQVVDGTVTRQVVRPLRVDLAVVTPDSVDWRSGLGKAGQFSTYCTRVLAIGGIPGDIAEARAAAAHHGIGLVVGTGGSSEMIVPPRCFTSTAHTAAGWRFAEQVYSQVVSRGLA